MATFDSTNIEFTFVAPPAAGQYSYAGMPLSTTVPVGSQLQVRWDILTVYAGNTEGNGGTATSVSDLPIEVQEAIRILPESLYTVDADKQTIALAVLSDTAIVNPTGQQVTYYRPPSGVSYPSATEPIRIRRSTDINLPVVTFTPGSRLTAGLLNASATQLLHASQELTAFTTSGGSSGSGNTGPLDLSGNTIGQLGNVTTTTSGVLQYDSGTQTVTTGSISGGGLVPLGTGLNTNHYLRKASSAAGDYEFFDLGASLVGINNSISANGTEINAINTTLAYQSVAASPAPPDGITTFTGDLVVAPNAIYGNAGNVTASGNVAAGGNVTATGIAGTMQAERFEFKGNNLNGYLYMGSTGTTPNSSQNNYRIQAFPSSTASADQRNIWRLNSAGWVYMFNRWQANGENVYDYPRIFQTANQYSQNVQGTHNSVGDGSYTLQRGGDDYYQAMLVSSNRIYSPDPGNVPYAVSKMNYVHLRDDLNGQYNYTMMTSPGDYHSKAFSVIKDGNNIFSVDKGAGNVYAGGDVNARSFNINSDATLKTYVPAQNPNESSTKVIDKIQTMVNNGESIAGGVVPPGANANEKFGAFEYNTATGEYHYGPTTQALTANGLSVINGENINVPGEEARAAELGADGAADVPAVPAVPAVPSTQTISTVSLGGLAMKASSQLKDLSDEVNNNIVYLTNYIQALEARVASLEGNSPSPPVLPSPTVGTGQSGGEGGQLGGG